MLNKLCIDSAAILGANDFIPCVAGGSQTDELNFDLIRFWETPTKAKNPVSIETPKYN